MRRGPTPPALNGIPREGTACQQSAQTEQEKPGLAKANTPKNLPGFIARILSQRLFGGVVQKIH
jgi:hypothetical protein